MNEVVMERESRTRKSWRPNSFRWKPWKWNLLKPAVAACSCTLVASWCVRGTWAGIGMASCESLRMRDEGSDKLWPNQSACEESL